MRSLVQQGHELLAGDGLLFQKILGIAHTIVITIKMNDFILNIYLVCYIINEVMQRNVLP